MLSRVRCEWVVINKLRSQVAAFELMRSIKCQTHTNTHTHTSRAAAAASCASVCFTALVAVFGDCVLAAFRVQLQSFACFVVAAHKCAAAELNACFNRRRRRCRHCRIVAVKATL